LWADGTLISEYAGELRDKEKDLKAQTSALRKNKEMSKAEGETGDIGALETGLVFLLTKSRLSNLISFSRWKRAYTNTLLDSTKQ
jgi:hypothetical protein